VFDRYFALISDFMRGNRKYVLLGVILLTLTAGAGLFFVNYEGNIDLMLPPDRDIDRSMSFLRDSNLSDKVIVSLKLTSADKSRKDLFEAVDQLAASLSPPLFSKVTTGFSVANVMDGFFLNYAPQLLAEKDLSAVDGRINADSVSERLKRIYIQSMKPESVFMVPMFRADPLGINFLLMEKLKALPASMGYDVTVEDGHFISRDGRHAMLIIQTPVKMTDGPNSKRLLTVLYEKLGRLPGYVSADVISGHLHTVSNEKVIRRDISLLSIMVSIVFLLLFFAIFRDMRVVFVYIIPLLAVILAVNISYFFVGKLSYLVIGFGTAIAGISVDYGLMVYVSSRKGADSFRTLKLAKLLCIDAITSAFGFYVLYFSKIHGYHQLALFSMLCIVISLFFALFILPLALSWKKLPKIKQPRIEDRLEKHPWLRNVSIGLWAVLTVAAAVLSFNVRIESDIKQLDGSGPEVVNAEKNFHAVWGGNTGQAIFVVTGNTFEEAMKTNDAVFQRVSASLGTDRFSSLSMFWSAEETRRKNVENWNDFWKQGREVKLRGLIKSESRKYGFSEDAFSPFFDDLYKVAGDSGSPNELIANVKERFVQQRPKGYRILSFFPDEKEFVQTMSDLSGAYPGTFVVSGRALSESISRFTSREAKLLVPLAIIFNIVLTYLFFRNIKETVIALIPVLTGMVWLSGLMSLFGFPLNVVNIVAAIITSGVIVDYGIGRTYDYRNNLTMGTAFVVSLSAATNIIGAGALLFAKHPAFFSTGVAMVICMSAGYLSAMFVVPPFCSILSTRKQEGDDA
jgi:predicted exporter